ncbi:hypothetical protein GLYMA_14G162251v4 [Glycine max]|nr:hypothetical protein GLYMA_14G162251v4 [Glycine max]KAH1094855.1 hypothetical protein GYH30_040240 [Glycine max]
MLLMILCPKHSFWRARYRRQSQRKIPSKHELSLQRLQP